IRMKIPCFINLSTTTSKTGALGELLNEIHQNGIPWFLGYGQLLERSIWFMPRGFCPTTSGARLAKVQYKSSEFWPGVVPEDQGHSLGLTKMSSEQVIMSH